MVKTFDVHVQPRPAGVKVPLEDFGGEQPGSRDHEHLNADRWRHGEQHSHADAPCR